MQPRPSAAALQRALSRLVTAGDEQALRRVLDDNPELLQPSMDALLTQLAQAAIGKRDHRIAIGFLSARGFLARLRRGDDGDRLPAVALPLLTNSPLLLLNDPSVDLTPRGLPYLREALGLVRRESEPDLWARLEYRLAFALAKASGPGRTARLREAAAHYRLALQVWGRPPHAGTARWATAQYNLGHALLSLTLLAQDDGDLEAQRREAIQCYECALQVCAPEADPTAWAQATRELALALGAIADRKHAADQERAIALLQTIVGAHPAPRPERWHEEQGRAWIALGWAHTHRLTGGRAINLGQARAAYRNAKRLLPRGEYAVEWARMNHNAALVGLRDPDGDRAANLASAERAARRALRVLTKEGFPDDWAQAQTALGNILCQRGGPDRRRRLAEAVACYRSALDVCAEEDDREHWATLQSNLANALAEQGMEEPARQEEALRLYHLALRGRPRWESPTRWAETMNNLGVTYAERRGGVPGSNRRRAARCLRRALEIRTPTVFPVEARQAARNLAQVELAAGRWRAAARAYATAIRAGDELYRMSISSTGREAELAEGRGLYAGRALALVRMGRLARAVTCLEAGRARALAEGLDLRQLVAGTADEVLQGELSQTLEHIHALEAELRQARGRPLSQVVRELEEARARLPPLERRLSFDAIAAQASPGHPLAYLADAGTTIFALVVGAGGGRAPRVGCVGPVRLALPPGVALRWPEDREGQDALLAPLGQALVGPLAALLREAQAGAVTLIPCGRLGLLPLHATPYEGAEGPACLIDELAVAYTPSARVLAAARARARRRLGPPRLAGVGNPLPSDDPLPGAEQELHAIASLLGGRVACALTGERATREALLGALPRATLVHLACHGSFHQKRPLTSSLQLGGGEQLSLAQLLDPGFRGLDQARLVVLSACRSAVIEAERLPDEAIGLPAGFLQAGAPSVVGTLWNVNDWSTALLMIYFYDLILAGAGPAEALCRAQRWLRDSSVAQLRGYLDDCGARGALRGRQVLELSTALSRHDPHRRLFADRHYWAPFTIQGAVEGGL